MKNPDPENRIPITVIGGYLGAGKTTLINRILACTSDPIGILVNDFGDLNIDAVLIKNRDDITLELTNGCVCCQISDDIGEALESIRLRKLSRVIIEASGVALPARIAGYGRNWPGFTLQGVYTVVDSNNIERLLEDKYVKHLVRDQIQQANQVLITRTGGKEAPLAVTELADKIFDLDENCVLPECLLGTGKILGSEVTHLDSDCHAEFSSTTFISDHSLSRDAVRKFIKRHPNIHRAKGWLRDPAGNCWLLQMTLNRCIFSPVNEREKTQLVFVCTGDNSLDAGELLDSA